MTEELWDQQSRYRTGFTELLRRIIRFEMLKERFLQVTEGDDIQLFYCNLLNNVRVEKLSEQDLNRLQKEGTQELIDSGFFVQTYQTVLYEDKNRFYQYGPFACPEYFASGRSIVIELQYSQQSCQTVEQIFAIQDFAKECVLVIREDMAKVFDAPVSFILENGIGWLSERDEDRGTGMRTMIDGFLQPGKPPLL